MAQLATFCQKALQQNLEKISSTFFPSSSSHWTCLPLPQTLQMHQPQQLQEKRTHSCKGWNYLQQFSQFAFSHFTLGFPLFCPGICERSLSANGFFFASLVLQWFFQGMHLKKWHLKVIGCFNTLRVEAATVNKELLKLGEIEWRITTISVKN